MNTLDPNGFPPHLLKLKPGVPLMLLRNLNPHEGLCNGTKLVFERSLDNKVLLCRVAGSDKTVLIPRIICIPKPNEYPFGWVRRQFPVKIAFASTINKSQGKKSDPLNFGVADFFIPNLNSSMVDPYFLVILPVDIFFNHL